MKVDGIISIQLPMPSMTDALTSSDTSRYLPTQQQRCQSMLSMVCPTEHGHHSLCTTMHKHNQMVPCPSRLFSYCLPYNSMPAVVSDLTTGCDQPVFALSSMQSSSPSSNKPISIGITPDEMGTTARGHQAFLPVSANCLEQTGDIVLQLCGLPVALIHGLFEGCHTISISLHITPGIFCCSNMLVTHELDSKTPQMATVPLGIARHCFCPCTLRTQMVDHRSHIPISILEVSPITSS